VDGNFEKSYSLHAPVLVDDRADDEHGRAQRHETAAPHPALLCEDRSRLDDLGLVDDDFRGPVGPPNQIVVLLERELDVSVARRLDFVDVGDFVGHVLSLRLEILGCYFEYHPCMWRSDLIVWINVAIPDKNSFLPDFLTREILLNLCVRFLFVIGGQEYLDCGSSSCHDHLCRRVTSSTS
jgi:hypothetical protein